MVATAPCPTDEEIAAFLDGALKGEDRDRVVQHLNECPDCYELFVETAEILDECGVVRSAAPPAPEAAPVPERGEARILQHRKREPRSFWKLGLPLAAALVALVGGYVGLGFATNRPQLLDGRAQMAEHIAFWVPFDYFWGIATDQPPVAESPDQVASNLTAAEKASFFVRVQDEILPPVSRGSGEESAALMFDLGARTADYEFFRQNSDATLDDRVRPSIVRLLDQLGGRDFLAPPCTSLLPGEGELTGPSWDKSKRLSHLESCVATLQQEFVKNQKEPDFLLGHWTESTRIALAGDHLSFFAADARRVPAWRLRQAGSFWQWVTRREKFPLPPEVEPLLKSLRDLVGDGVTPEEKTQVEEKLKELAETYAASADE